MLSGAVSYTHLDVYKRQHEEIARFIGSAREVVSKTLKGFVAEGILKTGRGKIEILDGEKLKKKGLM